MVLYKSRIIGGKAMGFEFNSIEEIAADLAAGKPVVMLDNEDRENEGDVICAAEFATTENVNFMAKWARGLICMPMDASFADKLNLPQMCITNTDNHCTAFFSIGRSCGYHHRYFG